MPKKLEGLLVMAIITAAAYPFVSMMKPVSDNLKKITAPHLAQIEELSDAIGTDFFESESESPVELAPVVYSPSPLWNFYQKQSYTLSGQSLLVPDARNSSTIDQYFFLEIKPNNYVELVKP